MTPAFIGGEKFACMRQQERLAFLHVRKRKRCGYEGGGADGGIKSATLLPSGSGNGEYFESGEAASYFAALSKPDDPALGAGNRVPVVSSGREAD